MSTAEIIIAVFGGIAAILGGMAWIGTVLVKRIEAKRDLDLKNIDQDIEESAKLKKTLLEQKETIRSQSDQIQILKHQISAMQLKLTIIVPMLRKALRNDPDIAEILEHLEKFETGNKTSANG